MKKIYLQFFILKISKIYHLRIIVLLQYLVINAKQN